MVYIRKSATTERSDLLQKGIYVSTLNLFLYSSLYFSFFLTNEFKSEMEAISYKFHIVFFKFLSSLI